jgi:hypothetical protein
MFGGECRCISCATGCPAPPPWGARVRCARAVHCACVLPPQLTAVMLFGSARAQQPSCGRGRSVAPTAAVCVGSALFPCARLQGLCCLCVHVHDPGPLALPRSLRVLPSRRCVASTHRPAPRAPFLPTSPRTLLLALCPRSFPSAECCCLALSSPPLHPLAALTAAVCVALTHSLLRAPPRRRSRVRHEPTPCAPQPPLRPHQAAGPPPPPPLRRPSRVCDAACARCRWWTSCRT